MNISIGPLRREDVSEADRIFRLAFGTFLGLSNPTSFGGEAEMVRSRWQAEPEAALGAYSDGSLVGANFVARWGSFGFFGPLSVRPDLWDRGIAKRLLEATMTLFELWKTPQIGLFTFAHSPKHLALYQQFGFWPRFLTALMAKPVERAAGDWGLYSQIAAAERKHCLQECRQLTGEILPDLDVEREIRAVQDHALGETVLLREDGVLTGLAVCHIGKGSEAGKDEAYVKFGAARPGADAARRFGRLLAACEALAADRGAGWVVAGVNTARHEAYRAMLDHGFRTSFMGVAMQRPNEPGYNRPGCFVLDDWR